VIDDLLVSDLRDWEQAERHFASHRLEYFFPDRGPYRRDLYPKHLEFFRAGRFRRSRAFLAANRVGKSIAGAFEMAVHLTGKYPTWWEGKRFHGPIKAWSCGLNHLKVRDSLQRELLGQLTRRRNGSVSEVIGLGTGMLPAESICATRPKSGVTDAVDTIHVQHYDPLGNKDGVSVCVFKSYDQGVDAFSAEAVHVIHLDEEPERAIFTECSIRTSTTKGIVLITATPLLGMTEMVIELMEAFRDQPPMESSSNAVYVVQASWDDAPHLTEEEKRQQERQIPPYQRDARMRGIPQMGAGAVYPIEESAISVKPFEIPDWWPRCYALDVGNNTGALWFAHDRNAGRYILYREYFRAGDIEAVPPSIHAAAIKGARNKDAWMPGVVDPAARGRSQTDGRRLLEMYEDLGLDLTPANNSVESGIQEVLDAFNTGTLKVFSDLQFFWQEFRLYRRDAKKGKVVKKKDHLMDAMRYGWVSGRDIMRVRPASPLKPAGPAPADRGGPLSWMG